MKKYPIKGVLHYYFATGEQGRPQFIGNSSVNSTGHVINYDEVYDLELGDCIQFLSGPLKHPHSMILDEDTFHFISYLTAMWNEKVMPLDVEFIPATKHKSWANMIKKSKS